MRFIIRSQTTYLFQLINSLNHRHTKRVEIYCLNLDFSLNSLQVLRLILAHSYAQFAEKRKKDDTETLHPPEDSQLQ